MRTETRPAPGDSTGALTAAERARVGGAPSLLRRLGPGRPGNGIYWVLLVVVVAAFAIVESTGGSFVTAGNVRNMLTRSVALGIVSVGQTLVILAGSLDLSVAYLISAAAIMAGVIMDGDPSRQVVGVLAVLGLGAAVGLVNGLIVTKLDVHPFIATLGTGLIIKGALSSRFASFAGEVPEEFQQLGYGLVGPVPVSVLLFAAIAALAAWTLRSTTFGAHLYAVGGDIDVARLSGVRADRTLIRAHVLCSLTAVVTGLYIAARLGSGAPWVGPDGGYDLESIAAVVLGGTALTGGRGRVAGTVAAVIILAVLDNVFNALQLDSFLKQVVRGLIIIAAVAAYSFRNERSEG